MRSARNVCFATVIRLRRATRIEAGQGLDIEKIRRGLFESRTLAIKCLRTCNDLGREQSPSRCIKRYHLKFARNRATMALGGAYGVSPTISREYRGNSTVDRYSCMYQLRHHQTIIRRHPTSRRIPGSFDEGCFARPDHSDDRRHRGHRADRPAWSNSWSSPPARTHASRCDGRTSSRSFIDGSYSEAATKEFRRCVQDDADRRVEKAG